MSQIPTQPNSPAPIRPDETITIIRPQNRMGVSDVLEIWRYRELMWMLAARDVKVRYKQTVIGGMWALLQPLATTGIFVLIFGLLLGRENMPTAPGVPYVVSTFCALVPWQLFAYSLSQASNSLVENERLITKVYFPKLIIPAAAILSGVIDFAVGMLFLVVLMVFYGIAPGIGLIALPLFFAMIILASLGAGMWLAALNAMYRDVRYTVPFIIQVGLFVTPVVYSSSSVLDKLPVWAQWLFMLNPMAGAIEGFRWALLGGAAPSPMLLGISCLGVAGLFLSGCTYFKRMERTLADWI